MSDFLQMTTQWLADMHKGEVSRQIVYKRQGLPATAQITATLARKTLKVTDDRSNARLVRADRDYLIEVADLQAYVGTSLAAGKPLPGDTITDIDGTYQVSPPEGQPHYQVDERTVRFRIHTKRVA